MKKPSHTDSGHALDAYPTALERLVWRYRRNAASPSAQHGPGQAAVSGQANYAGLQPDTDQLADEVPVALEYNGISHATMLATPADLDDLARGFSLTEGIIRQPGDIYDTETVTHDNGITVQVTIASACLDQLKRRRRTLAGRTGCGLCGLESLHEVERPLAPLATRQRKLDTTALLHATEQLRNNQPLHALTGATHAAGWANAQGQLLAVREDVGRHNALDKLIGHLSRSSEPLAQDGFVVISSRASFEMIQKAAAAGISAVIAVSAPTAYAARKAQDLNMLLAGFTRQNTFTLYTHPDYLCSKETAS